VVAQAAPCKPAGRLAVDAPRLVGFEPVELGDQGGAQTLGQVVEAGLCVLFDQAVDAEEVLDQVAGRGPVHRAGQGDVEGLDHREPAQDAPQLGGEIRADLLAIINLQGVLPALRGQGRLMRDRLVQRAHRMAADDRRALGLAQQLLQVRRGQAPLGEGLEFGGVEGQVARPDLVHLAARVHQRQGQVRGGAAHHDQPRGADSYPRIEKLGSRTVAHHLIAIDDQPGLALGQGGPVEQTTHGQDRFDVDAGQGVDHDRFGGRAECGLQGVDQARQQHPGVGVGAVQADPGDVRLAVALGVEVLGQADGLAAAGRPGDRDQAQRVRGGQAADQAAARHSAVGPGGRAQLAVRNGGRDARRRPPFVARELASITHGSANHVALRLTLSRISPDLKPCSPYRRIQRRPGPRSRRRRRRGSSRTRPGDG
jgi:hypothetical protein